MSIQSILQRLSNYLVSMSRDGKTALMAISDTIALSFCFMLAMWLRLGDLSQMLTFGYMPYLYIPAITVIVFFFAGLYRAVVRFIDRHLLTRTILALGGVVLFSYALSFFMSTNKIMLPRNALLIYWLVAFAYVLASRLTVRSFLRRHASSTNQTKISVAIYGASAAGVRLLEAMRADQNYNVLCFLDDKSDLVDRTISGLRVFDTNHLSDLVSQLGISQIIVAVTSASLSRRAIIFDALKKSRVPIKVAEGLLDHNNGILAKRLIRDVQIEDLLGRSPVPPRLDLFAKCISEQRVLITGAGGSIGSELCRQVATQSPDCLHLLDHSEYALYAIEQELRSRFPAVPIRAHLGSVCNHRLVNRIMSEQRIDTVYHSAAYKHVPLVESNITEGICNNVLGAKVVADAAKNNSVKTCVLVSTDKAVRPTNIMGASKRIAEMIFQAAAIESPNGTTFCMVRFGNVLGSSGSVVPLFRQQIESGGPITITHPDVIRYFMLIPEAAQLVIQAGAMAKGGDVFVLDMGDPVRITDLARMMLELAGIREKRHGGEGEIEIKYIGLRPGEKLYEELLISEGAQPSEHPLIMHTSEAFVPADVLNPLINRLLAACEQNDSGAAMEILRVAVAEYWSPDDCVSVANLDKSQKPFVGHHAPANDTVTESHASA